jgi:hypothetical protein
MYTEELEMFHNPLLSRQQARSIFEREWLFPPPEPTARPKEGEDDDEI